MAEPPRILDLGLSKPLSTVIGCAASACLQRCRKVPALMHADECFPAVAATVGTTVRATFPQSETKAPSAATNFKATEPS
jgi:hypothetical protein